MFTMERKLADFRARRQAKRTSSQSGAASAAAAEALANAQENEQTEGASDESSRGMLDSWWWKWLSTRRFSLANITLLKVLLWIVLLSFFVELEFGLAFFVVSLFYWMYEGMRDPDEYDPEKLSAYSVFNPDCQPLPGALTAEQLEAEMGYRPIADE